MLDENNTVIKQLKESKYGSTSRKNTSIYTRKLVVYFGFDTLAELIPINCFKSNPSVKSSLTFLRKTPWARKKVEDLYVKFQDRIENENYN